MTAPEQCPSCGGTTFASGVNEHGSLCVDSWHLAHVIDKRFTYHAPTPEKIERHADIREWGRQFAHAMLEQCPASSERAHAIDRLEEVVYWANAAIARHELGTVMPPAEKTPLVEGLRLPEERTNRESAQHPDPTELTGHQLRNEGAPPHFDPGTPSESLDLCDGWLQMLDRDGWPVGPRVPLGEVITFGNTPDEDLTALQDLADHVLTGRCVCGHHVNQHKRTIEDRVFNPQVTQAGHCLACSCRTFLPAAEQDPTPMRPWSGVIGFEARQTDDGRTIHARGLSWPRLPIPLMGLPPWDGSGHSGAKVIGRVDEIHRYGAAIVASGMVDPGKVNRLSDFAILDDDEWPTEFECGLDLVDLVGSTAETKSAQGGVLARTHVTEKARIAGVTLYLGNDQHSAFEDAVIHVDGAG